MSSVAEKGAAAFEGIKLLLCENPLRPLDAAIAAAERELPHANFYTEPFSAPLRAAIASGSGSPSGWCTSTPAPNSSSGNCSPASAARYTC
jgi:histidinol-phosphate aminotransferase